MKKFLGYMMVIVMLLSFGVPASANEGSLPDPVVAREIGDVTLYSFLSDSVSPVVVEGESLVLIDYPGDSEEKAAAYVEFIESLGKPVDRLIISHVDEAHWINIEKFLPDVDLYSVDAEEIMALPAGSALEIAPLEDDASLAVDGVQYEFVTNREIGAWEIKMPELQAVYVEHLGYVNLHVLLAPLQPRVDMLKALEAEDYTWFMPGHGVPAENPGFVGQVEAYYADVMAAVDSHADAADAAREIAEKYPEYNTQGMLEAMVPGLYP